MWLDNNFKYPFLPLNRCPAGKIKLHVRPSSQPIPRPGISTLLGNQRAAAPSVVTLKPVTTSTTTAPTVSATNSFQTSSQWQSGVRFQLVQHGGSYKGSLFYVDKQSSVCE